MEYPDHQAMSGNPVSPPLPEAVRERIAAMIEKIWSPGCDALFREDLKEFGGQVAEAAAQQERARLAELFRRELKPAEGNTIANSDELADYLAMVASHPPPTPEDRR
jgi:hypothetical protein